MRALRYRHSRLVLACTFLVFNKYRYTSILKICIICSSFLEMYDREKFLYTCSLSKI